jgi:hypothetical protein
MAMGTETRISVASKLDGDPGELRMCFQSESWQAPDPSIAEAMLI